MFSVYCEGLKITRSMSLIGHCWDNSVIEKFL